MDNIERQAGKFLKGLSFFKGLDDADVDSFMSAARIRTYRKQEQLLRQGDSADRFFVVLSGWIKLCRQTDEGDEAVMALFTRGDVFAEAAIFGGGTYPYTAEVAEESRVIEIPARMLKEMAHKNPKIIHRVMASMSQEIKKQHMNNEHIALMNSAQRVGCLLLRLSSEMLGTGAAFTFPYDKSLAAAQLGMKPETFSRSLAQLKPAKVVSKGAEIEIGSFCALSQFCCKNCTAEAGECPGARALPEQRFAGLREQAARGVYG